MQIGRCTIVLRQPVKVSPAALALVAALFGLPSLAQDPMSPRLQIAVGMLPAIIVANKRQTNGDDKSRPVYLVYRHDRHLAGQLQTALKRSGETRQLELQVETIVLSELIDRIIPPASTIFIVEPMQNNLQNLIEFARRQHVLLFSPFEGDVERGVATGFRVTDMVLPMVNMNSLKQSNIYLKAFFLRVAVKYEK